MATAQFTLKIEKIHEREQKTDTFALRMIDGIEDMNNKFDNYIRVQGNNDMADRMRDEISVGDVVSFEVYINGKKWENGKGETVIFQNLVVSNFRIMKKATTEDTSEGVEPGEVPWETKLPYEKSNDEHFSSDNDDLPF